MSHINIIGAGLAGSLLAIYLARRGFEIDVYEARGDMRHESVAAGRSINLALSDRGITALRNVGMDEYMLAEAVPMYGLMIHSEDGDTKLLRYSGREGEYINSVSRAGLNIALMNEAEKYPGVQFIFNERCVDFDCASGEAMFESGRSRRADTLIATDGAGSMVRQSMERKLSGFESSSVFLEHEPRVASDYKSLSRGWFFGCQISANRFGDPPDVIERKLVGDDCSPARRAEADRHILNPGTKNYLLTVLD